MTLQDGDGHDESVPIDLSFAALSDPYRRSVCRYAMRTEAEAVPHEDLVDAVDDRRLEPDRTDLDREAVATELHHVHLPKLDEAGLLEYDRQRGVAHVDRETLGDRLECVRATVAALQDTPVDP